MLHRQPRMSCRSPVTVVERALSRAASLLRPTDTGPAPPGGSMPSVRAARATSWNSSVNSPAVAKPCEGVEDRIAGRS